MPQQKEVDGLLVIAAKTKSRVTCLSSRILTGSSPAAATIWRYNDTLRSKIFCLYRPLCNLKLDDRLLLCMNKLCCILNPKYQCTYCLKILCGEELRPDLWFTDGSCNHIGLRDWPMTGMTYSRERS